jgi:predicted DCC family thiol-disulfide oxidoreductase YuxK
MSTPGGVILFDGVCNLCNGAVQFVIRRDPHGRFRFAALQSDAAKRLLAEAWPGPGPVPDSIVYIENGVAHVRSSAALRIARDLGFPWCLARIFTIIPRGLRDAVYDSVARRRFAWFGARDACMVPTPELRARFLDGDDR